MSSKSERRGASASQPEVMNISTHGFWLAVAGEELFLPFKEFPWFRHATVNQIASVTMPSPGHLSWPDLDIDLAVASVRDPSAFPLVSDTPA